MEEHFVDKICISSTKSYTIKNEDGQVILENKDRKCHFMDIEPIETLDVFVYTHYLLSMVVDLAEKVNVLEGKIENLEKK